MTKAHTGEKRLAKLSQPCRSLDLLIGALPGKPLSDLQPFWRRVRARAGLKDVHIHDLRHTFASLAVAAGQGLPTIGKLLGETQVQTTAH